MNILYIACEPNIGDQFLLIAKALKTLFPDSRNILVDPSDVLYPSFKAGDSPGHRFRENGFEAEISDSNNYRDLSALRPKYESYLFYFDLYKRLNPSVVIVPYEWGYAFYAVQAAKLFNIPTYHVQHGIWGPEKFNDYYAKNKEINKKDRHAAGRVMPRYLLHLHGLCDRLMEAAGFIYHQLKKQVAAAKRKKGLDTIPDSLMPYKDNLASASEHYPINSDRMAVYGPYYQRQLMDRIPRYHGDKVDLVGLLKSDVIFNGGIEPVEAIHKRYHLEKGKKLVLYFFSPFQDFPDLYHLEYHPNDALMDAIRTLNHTDDNLNILILLHPNFRFQHYKHLLDNLMIENAFTNVRIDKAHNDHFSLYKLASMVMGVKSATLYEAMIFNVPVVVQAYVLSKVYDPQHIEAGAAAPVFSPAHMSHQIKRALTDHEFQKRMFENQKMVCRDLFGDIDGKCGQRVGRAIGQLIDDHDNQSKLKTA